MKRLATQLVLEARCARPQRPMVKTRAFAASARRTTEKKQKKSEQADSERELQPGKSPFATFVEVIREEIEKNRQSDNVKAVAGSVDAVADSKTWIAMRQAYERARLAASIQENPRIRKAAEDLVNAGGKVNDAVAEAIQQSYVYGALSRGASAMYEASEPIRQTEVYKAVAASVEDVLQDVRYGGYVERDARRQRRDARLKQIGRAEGMARKPRIPKVEANPDAGENIVYHPTANVEEPSASFSSRVLPSSVSKWVSDMKTAYQESENPAVATLRTITSTVGRVFDETETAKVARMFKELDPSFQQESFLNELREYIVPEVVDAFISRDFKTLKAWLSEAPYTVLTHNLQTIPASLISDSRVLDIRNVDVLRASILENEIPVFVVSFHTQEVHCFRDPKTANIVVGADDRVKSVAYVAVITRLEEELDNPETGGWKIIDMARQEM